MAETTSIEWTDSIWNPVRGCTRVSPGCGGANHEGGCYAEKIAARFSDVGQPYHGLAERTKHGGRWTGRVRLIEEALTLPLRWKKPRRIFVNSMSDLFHEGLADADIDKVFAVMALAPQHTFRVLTKRAARMRGYLSAGRAHPVGLAALEQVLRSMAENPNSQIGKGCILQGDIAHLKVWPLPNVWLGVSVEDQARADERIPDLLATPAAVRFLSCEPLLGPIDLRHIAAIGSYSHDALTLPSAASREYGDFSARIDLVIAGAESGPRARSCSEEWVRSLKDQCVAAGVSFFYKQAAINGRKIPTPELDGRTWVELPI